MSRPAYDNPYDPLQPLCPSPQVGWPGGQARILRSDACNLAIGYDTAMPHRTPWDGKEPVTEAMERWGLRESFQEAVDGQNREEAARILCAVGIDEEMALDMLAVLIPSEGETP